MNIFANMSEECNINCSHCYYAKKIHDKTKKKLNLDKYIEYTQKALDLFKHYKNNSIILHGAETLVLPRKDIEKYLKHFCGQKGLSFSVQTNFTLMDSDWVALFNKYNVGVGSSFDFDLNREIPYKKYEKYLKSINNFGGFIVSLTNKITEAKIDYLYQEFLPYLKKISAKHSVGLVFQPYTPSSLQEFKKVALSPQKLAKIISYIQKYLTAEDRHPLLGANLINSTVLMNSNCYAQLAILTREGKLYTCPALSQYPDKYLYDLNKGLLNKDFLKEVEANKLNKQGCFYRNFILGKDPYQNITLSS